MTNYFTKDKKDIFTPDSSTASQPVKSFYTQKTKNPFVNIPDPYTVPNQQTTAQQPTDRSFIRSFSDFFASSTSNIFQSGKNYVMTTLPQQAAQFFEDNAKSLRQVAGYTPEQEVQLSNLVQETKTHFSEKLIKANQRYGEWVAKEHPEWIPNEDIQEGIFKNPKLLKDPEYYAYVIGSLIPYSVATMGASAMTFAITKNPVAAVSTGLAISTPIVTQDLYEDLLENGATNEQALKISGRVGPVIAGVEAISDIPIFKALGVDKLFKKKLVQESSKQLAKLSTKQLIVKTSAKVGIIEFTETAEEVVQEAIQNAAVKIVNENRSIFENIPEVAVQTLIGALPLSAIGGVQDIRTAAKITLAQREQKLIELGFPKEDARELAQEGGYIGKSTNEIRKALEERKKFEEAKKEEIFKLETEVMQMSDALSEDKASKLEKYASYKGQKVSLPEVTGEKQQGIFKQTGDEIVANAGFADIQEAEQAFSSYSASKEILKEKEQALKEKRRELREMRTAGKEEAKEEFKALKDEEEFLGSIRKEILKDVKEFNIEQNKFLYDIKKGVLNAVEKEKNNIKKDILSLKNDKKLNNTVLLRLREKNDIESWSKANKNELELVLEDIRSLRENDSMLSLTQVESLKEFGVDTTTTKREAVRIFGDIKEWKDTHSSFFNFFKTIDQKVNNTAGKDADKVKDILTRPREKAVTNLIKEEVGLKLEMRNMLDKGKINNKKDRALIMRYGENRITLDELKKQSPDKWQKIVQADKWFREKYDFLLETTNAELSKFYSDEKLIPKRKDYYTHFQEIRMTWDLFNNQTGDTSPVIEQISEFTKPNRKFNPFAKRRKGSTDFIEDAGRAFEAYLTPILNNKHLTESIVRHRTVADILANNTLDSKNLNQFVNSLTLAANNLAGKTDKATQGVIDFIGRRPIQLLLNTVNRLGKNRIIGNVGSAIMQISGIATSSVRNGNIRTSLGLLEQAFSPLLGENDPIFQSTSLIRRYGEKGLQHGETVFPKFKIIKAGEKVAAFGFEVIEKNISKAIWRASYKKMYSKGFRGAELIQQTDEQFERTVGSRSIGEKALAFESGLISLPLQFQLEVNTLAQSMKEEIFDEYFKGHPVQATNAAINASISLFLLNTFFQALFGRAPLPDPIRAVLDASERDTWPEKIGRLVGEGLSSVPGGQFIAGLLPLSESQKKKWFGRSEVGMYQGGIPITTALKGAWQSPANFVYDFVLPYGGAQLKKLVEGLDSLDKVGSYTRQGQLQFSIDQSQWLKVILFGRYSTKEAQEYFDKERKPLSDKQTVEYFVRTKEGESPRAVYDDIMQNRYKAEYEKQITKILVKKIKDNATEGFAQLLLWKEQKVIGSEVEKAVFEELEK